MCDRIWPLGHELLEILRHSGEPDAVLYIATALPNSLGDLVLGELELRLKLRKGQALVERRQALTLKVFDQGQHQQLPVVGRLAKHDRRDGGAARPLARPPAPLASDKLVAAGPALVGPQRSRLHQDRLEHSVLGNRGRQLVKALVGWLGARLTPVGHNLADRQILHLLAATLSAHQQVVGLSAAHGWQHRAVANRWASRRHAAPP